MVSSLGAHGENVDAGVRHLRELLDSYGGNVRLSLAAYNAGAGAVARSAGVPHIKETQDYIRRITSLAGGASDAGLKVSGNRLGASSGTSLGTPLRTTLGAPARDPVEVRRDARGVLHISNTE